MLETKKGKNSSIKKDPTASRLGEGMVLKELLKGADCKVVGDKNVFIKNITADSRRIEPGSLFFAIEGNQYNGNLYISEAIDRGAVAVVTAQPMRGMNQVTTISSENVRKVMAQVAQRFYKCPDERIYLIGITGTNGKTTVSMLCQYLIKCKCSPVGLIGTVKYDLGQRAIPSRRTTPSAIDICSMLSEMDRSGCRQAFIEVSSHGIDQERVGGLKFKVASFLNLTSDHLDYHKTVENYYLAKKKFFEGSKKQLPEKAVINLDDPYGQRLISEIADSGIEIITVGLNDSSTLYADNLELTAEGCAFNLHWPGGVLPVKSSLLGEYNVYNILHALAICWAAGEPMSRLVQDLAGFPGVPGRMQRVDSGQAFRVLVDYAHTEDALKNALVMLRRIIKGKLITVFGCGGNRDKTKRPKMTEVVQTYSDTGFATADNPRKESMDVIFEDMKAGVTQPESIQFIEDRHTAIKQAIESAQEGDCVLIAGKGHEAYQEFADTIVPFDDCLVAKNILEELC